MKKVININLGGRVIPIEETAFDNLKAYVEALRNHFKDEEGRDEIIQDIENRIAELLEKEIKNGASCITDQKIEETIGVMGRVDDFIKMDETQTNSSSNEKKSASENESPRGSLFRNSNDKVLGGVCSGIANALRIDPVVVRVLFALFLLGGGSGLIVYIILWLVLPEQPLKANIQKKFFRNPDKKVLGGVASGLAAYFNIPVWIPRIVFLLPIVAGAAIDFLPSIIIGGGLGGTFFLTYIILWAVVPYANTPSEKMQMRGEKIDVNSIKNAFKEEMHQLKTRSGAMGEKIKTGAEQMSKDVVASANEYVGEAGSSVRRTGSTLGNILLMLIKIFLIFIAGVFAFAGMVLAGALTFAAIISIPTHGFFLSSSIQEWALWGTIFLFLITPVIGIIVWLIRRIVGAKSNKYLSLGFGILWALGWVSLFVLITGIAKEFSQEAVTSTSIQQTTPDSSTLIVSMNEPPIVYSKTYSWFHSDQKGFDITEDSLFYNNVNIIVEKSNKNEMGASILKYSYGENKKAALKRAENISFNVMIKDSMLLLDNGIGIDKNNKFRGQRVEIVIQLPVGKKIRFDEKLIDAYEPFVLDMDENGTTIREERRFDYEPGVEYIMTEDGLEKTGGKKNEVIPVENEVVFHKKEAVSISEGGRTNSIMIRSLGWAL